MKIVINKTTGQFKATVPDDFTLKNPENCFLSAETPVFKVDSNSEGLIIPIWDGTQWVEGATKEEIADFDRENPFEELPIVEKPVTREELETIELALMELFEVM